MDRHSPVPLLLRRDKFTSTRVPVRNLSSARETPKRVFSSFDNSWFVRSILGPSKLQILLLGILTAGIGIGLFTSLQPMRFCEFAGDRNCRPCPEYAVCGSDSLSCVSPAIEINGFCARKGTIEERALLLLPTLRDISNKSRDVELLSREMRTSTEVVAKALEFAEREDNGGLKSPTSKLLLGLFIALVFSCINRIYVRNRAVKEHQNVLLIMNALNGSKVPVSMEELCRRCKIESSPDARKRMLQEMSRLPQFYTDILTETVRKI